MQSSCFGSRVCCAPGVFVARRCNPLVLPVVAHYGNKLNLGGGKPWQRTDVNANGKPIKLRMHVRKGDIVQVITGVDKGTVAEVEKVIPTRGLIVVKGVNVSVRNVAPRTKDEQGSQTRQESPIHHSNVMHYSTAQQVRSRVGYRLNVTGRKVRYLVKTGEELPERCLKQDTTQDSSSSTGTDAASA